MPRELVFQDAATCEPGETVELETAFFIELWPRARADACEPLPPTVDAAGCEPAQLMDQYQDLGVLLYEVSADGRECRAYDLPGTNSQPQIVAGPDGDLYFFDQARFGRLRAP